MRRQDVEGLSPAEIRRRFSLPDTPTHMSDVILPKDTRLRIGRIGRGGEDVLQCEIEETLRPSWFRNTRELSP